MSPAAPPFDPAFCDTVLELGRQGVRKAALARALGVDLETLKAWRDEHAQFDFAVRAALTASRAWWEELPREVVDKDGTFRQAVWAKAMAHIRAEDPVGDEPEEDAVDDVPPAIFAIPDNGRTRRRRL